MDGTTNLIHSFRHSAISLALYENGKPLAGIIYDPFAGELFTATAGGGAFLNGEAISVSGAESLSESLCSVGTNPGVRQGADDAFRRLRAVYERCHDIRRIGAASIEMCYVACGRLEGYAEHGLKPWDYAAGRLIVEEAGGRVTEFDGKPPSIDGASCDILASNGLVHDELLSLM